MTNIPNDLQLLRDIVQELKEYAQSCGGCDHSVGICQCHLDSIIVRTVERLKMLEESWVKTQQAHIEFKSMEEMDAFVSKTLDDTIGYLKDVDFLLDGNNEAENPKSGVGMVVAELRKLKLILES